jgi:uncharacterized protein (TIGR00661 family)
MKILYAVQGTGNGHVSRARDFIPALQQFADVDILISGTQVDVSLPQEIKYKFKGAGFVFGKSGGVDYWETFKSLHLIDLVRDIYKLDLNPYDIIINDFEPVSAWAAKIKKKQVIALSHQASFLSKKTPRPNFNDAFAEGILKHYAPSTKQIAFHFEKYDEFINTPIIRKEIRSLVPENKGHYTVYLPAYSDKFLIEHLAKLDKITWHVFSKHEHTGYVTGNVNVQPIHNEKFNASLASSEGLLTGGGFEAPAEALFLGKKVLSIPMTGQYEQACNAEALRRLGVPVVKHIENDFSTILHDWIYNQGVIKVNFPDNLDEVVKKIFSI